MNAREKGRDPIVPASGDGFKPDERPADDRLAGHPLLGALDLLGRTGSPFMRLGTPDSGPVDEADEPPTETEGGDPSDPPGPEAA